MHTSLFVFTMRALLTMLLLSLSPVAAIGSGVGSNSVDANTYRSVDIASFEKKKQTTLERYLTAKEAYDAIQVDGSILLIDVRTRAETVFVGIPTDATANIPYVFLDTDKVDTAKNRYALTDNPHFTADVDHLVGIKGADKSTKIFLICRSGSRSARAADKLAEAGYANVWTVIDGFEGDKDESGRRTVNGWKNEGLPWSYGLTRDQVYIPSHEIDDNRILFGAKPPENTAAKSKVRYIRVERGDTLSSIALKYFGTASAYKRILEANRPRISDPDRIPAGLLLRLPG